MRKIENRFIEDIVTKFDWDDNAIYSIGVYDPKGSTITFYVGEAEVYKDRPLSYTPDVMAEFGKHENAVRVVQMFYRAVPVRKKLMDMEMNGTNPFGTVDLKIFRCIIERMYVDLFKIPPKFNKKRPSFSNYQLSAAFLLHIFSRKYKSIPECLDKIASYIDLIEDFDYITKQFVVYEDYDTSKTIRIKEEINSLITDIMLTLCCGKYLQQGGYQCWADGIIYDSDDIKVVSSEAIPSSDHHVFIKQLWNTGYGDDCISLYKDLSGKKTLFIKPQRRGLGVDIGSWITKEVPELDDEVIEDIKREILLPSTL